MKSNPQRCKFLKVGQFQQFEKNHMFRQKISEQHKKSFFTTQNCFPACCCSSQFQLFNIFCWDHFMTPIVNLMNEKIRLFWRFQLLATLLFKLLMGLGLTIVLALESTLLPKVLILGWSRRNPIELCSAMILRLSCKIGFFNLGYVLQMLYTALKYKIT